MNNTLVLQSKPSGGEETAGQFPRTCNRSGSNEPGHAFVVALIDIVSTSIQVLNL